MIHCDSLFRILHLFFSQFPDFSPWQQLSYFLFPWRDTLWITQHVVFTLPVFGAVVLKFIHSVTIWFRISKWPYCLWFLYPLICPSLSLPEKKSIVLFIYCLFFPDLEFTRWPRLALNSKSSCLRLLSTGLTEICHQHLRQTGTNPTLVWTMFLPFTSFQKQPKDSATLGFKIQLLGQTRQ